MNFPLSMPELPVRLTFERPMTDLELMRFSRENKIFRIERESNGDLLIMSPTGLDGGDIDSKVYLQLAVWTEGNGRGVSLGASPGFTLPDDSVRAADASWMSLTRWNSVDAKIRKGYAPIVPEFIIEVRSESDRLKPLQDKMRLWLASGAELAWLIDPQRKVIEIYREGQQPEIHENPTSVLGTGPVAGFELILSRIWG